MKRKLMSLLLVGAMTATMFWQDVVLQAMMQLQAMQLQVMQQQQMMHLQMLLKQEAVLKVEN